MSVEKILRQAWELYTRFFLRLVLTAAAVFVVLEFFAAAAAASAHSHHWTAATLWGIAAFVLWIVGTFWLQGALVEAVSDIRDGRADLSIEDLFRRAQPLLPALIGAGFAAGLGIVGGLILFVVPGLVLLTRWILIVPVIVLEKKPAGEAFSRSWNLVKGSSWPVFWLTLLTMIALGAASPLITLVLSPLTTGSNFFASWIGGTIAGSLTAPFAALAWTLAYFELVRQEARPSASMMPPIQV